MLSVLQIARNPQLPPRWLPHTTPSKGTVDRMYFMIEEKRAGEMGQQLRALALAKT